MPRARADVVITFLSIESQDLATWEAGRRESRVVLGRVLPAENVLCLLSLSVLIVVDASYVYARLKVSLDSNNH